MVSNVNIYHDSRDSFYRSPLGAQPCGNAVQLRLRVSEGDPEHIFLRVWYGQEFLYPLLQMPEDEGCYEVNLALPTSPCLLWYDFQVWKNGQFYWYGNAEDGLGGVGAPIFGQPRSFQITVYDPGFCPPNWTRGAIWYQIFPDRFAQGEAGPNLPLPRKRGYHTCWDEMPSLVINAETGDNIAHDFFGGTLCGIRENLPYLASLGITAVYLNPIFSASTNHRFDTIDWMSVDPALGTKADFEALCRAADAYNIHIVLDGVFSHSGSENPFFMDARARARSPYRSWYTFFHWPDVYKSWWGFQTLPELNKHEPAVWEYFLSSPNAVVRTWPKAGASGWRIDVADELPMEYLRQLRQGVKEARKDAIVLGEVWEDASNKISYGEMRCYCLGDTLDGVMNYPLREAAVDFLLGNIDASVFKRRMDSLYENYPAPFANSLLNVLGTHDRPRILNVLAGMDGEDIPREERHAMRLTKTQRMIGKKRLAVMLAMVVALPGMPCVYYGDEAGMEGAADPYNRGTFPWGREDQEVYDLFQTSLQRKKTVPALMDGQLYIEVIDSDVLVIQRKTRSCTATTMVNRSDSERNVSFCGEAFLLSGYGVRLWELD